MGFFNLYPEPLMKQHANPARQEWAKASHLPIFAKGNGSRFHIQDAGDEVPLGEAGQGQRLLPVMVEVATVGSVQPHVGGGAMVEIVNGPTRHSHARAFVASVFLHNVELESAEQH